LAVVIAAGMASRARRYREAHGLEAHTLHEVTEGA